MIAYHYNEETQCYDRLQECQLDPLETELSGHEVWLLPSSCTFKKPPKEKEGYLIKWRNGEWEYEKLPEAPMTFEQKPKPPTLEEVKAAKIIKLKAYRDEREADPVSVEGVGMFDYDNKSRERLAIARQFLEDSNEVTTLTWTTVDNQRVSVGLEDFIAINNSAALRSNALHIKYNALKEEVNKAETAEEVSAITWE